MSLIAPPQPTPAKPEYVNARLPRQPSRWRGGGEELTVDQLVVLVVVIVFAVSAPVITLAYVGFQAVGEFKDVSDGVAVGPWQDRAVQLTIGDTGLNEVEPRWVSLFVSDADGRLYFAGAVDQAEELPGTDTRVSVTYFDADGDGLVTAGDRITVVSEGTGANPLEGGQVQVWFGLYGQALKELP